MVDLKYRYGDSIRERGSRSQFCENFEALNCVKFMDAGFQRLLEEIVTPHIITAAHTLRNYTGFVRDHGTPLHHTLINLADWYENTFDVLNQLCTNTDTSLID